MAPTLAIWFRSVSDKVRAAPRSHLVVQGGLLLLCLALWRFQDSYGAPWEGRIGKHLRAGRELDFDELIHVQLWWAACIDLGLSAVLLLLSPCWLRWGKVGESGPPSECRTAPGPRVWRWLALGLLLALGVRLPRMDQTISRDEQDTLRRDIVGFVYPAGANRPQAEVVDWQHTLWEDEQANNPFLFSILARVTLRTWQWWVGAEPWRINRTVLRLWALIPGVLSLAALWWSMGLMGFPRASIFAVFFGALHPLHVFLSTQGRGYALVLLFSSLLPGFVWLSLQRGKWRHFWGLAGCFFGCLYSFPGSFFFIAVWGLTLAVFLLWRWLRRQDFGARANFVRLMVTSCAAALVFVPLVLPAVPQAAQFLRQFKGELEYTWPVSTWSAYASGVYMPDDGHIHEKERGWDTGHIVRVHLEGLEYLAQRYAWSEPLLFVFVFCLAPALVLVGASRLRRGPPQAWMLLPATALPPVLKYLVYRGPETPYVYYWYLIYLLPVVLLLVALGLETAGMWLRGRWNVPTWLPAFLFLSLLIAVNLPGLGRMEWLPGSQTADTEHLRGSYHFVTRPDGVTEIVFRAGQGESRDLR